MSMYGFKCLMLNCMLVIFHVVESQILPQKSPVVGDKGNTKYSKELDIHGGKNLIHPSSDIGFIQS